MLTYATRQRELKLLVTVMTLCATAFVILGSGSLAWMMYGDIYPPVQSNAVYTMDANGNITDRFRAGDVMLVYRDLCFNRDAPVTFGRTLRRISPSPLNVSINTTSGMMMKGCVKNPNMIRIPLDTPPGLYEFSNIMQYSNNAFQSGAIELPVPTIEIVK